MLLCNLYNFILLQDHIFSILQQNSECNGKKEQSFLIGGLHYRMQQIVTFEHRKINKEYQVELTK